MVREIITPTDTTITVQLPDEMVGKTIEILAFEIEKSEKNNDELNYQQRLERIRKITSSSLIDLSNFKFNRDEANNYDE